MGEPLALAIAALIPFLFFLPTLRYGFVYDDRTLVLENRVIQGGTSLLSYFQHDFASLVKGSDQLTSNYYRPLFLLLERVLWAFFGSNPVGWHFATVLLHAVVGLLAFLVLRQRTDDSSTAVAGSALFSLHPIHVDSAAWISGIQDVLGGLLALSAYLLWRSHNRLERTAPDRAITLFVVSAAALLAKESSFGLWLIVAAECAFASLAVAGAPLGRRLRGFAIMASAAGVVFLLRAFALGGIAQRHPAAPDDLTLLATLPRVILEYVRLSLMPTNLGFFSSVRPVESIGSATAVGSAAVLGLLVVGAIWSLRRRPELLAPVVWFFAWLAPHLALSAMNPEWIVFDRYLYVAVLALPMALVALGERWPRRNRFLVVSIAALAAAVGAFFYVPRFVSEEVFWKDAITRTPTSASAWGEWGKLRLDGGDVAEGRAALERAVALEPRALIPRLRLGNLSVKQGKLTEAESIYRGLIEANPEYSIGWRNLVAVLDAQGRRAEALVMARKAADRFPRDEDVLVTLVVMLRNAGRPGEAIEVARNGRARAVGGGAKLAELERRLLAEGGTSSGTNEDAEE